MSRLISAENLTLRERVGDEAAVDMMKEAGFTGIDYNFCAMRDWDTAVGAPDGIQKAAALRRYAQARGMCFSQSHAPFTFRFGMEMTPDDYEYYRIVRSMEAAAALGAPMIVVHSVLDTGDCDHMEYNLRFYRSLLPYAERFGIRIAVENLTGRLPGSDMPSVRNLGTPEAFCEIQDRLNSPFIVGCLDLGHANMTTGDTPGFIRQSAGHVQYLHVHDNDGTHDMHQLPAVSRALGKDAGWDKKPLPDGARHRDFQKKDPYLSQPWDKILAALKEIRYEGPFNLELPKFFSHFATEHLPLALQLAAGVGKMMAEELDR